MLQAPCEDLRITLLQGDPHWEAPQENRNYWEEKLKEIGPTDVVVFPEMFTTGFTMNAEKVAEPLPGPTLDWMHQWAEKLSASLVGSFPVKLQGRFYHRLFWVYPSGGYESYDKRHLFSPAGETKVYERGRKRLVLTYKSWRIAPFLCYDLRFPVFLRNLGQRYDLALFLANWPEKRREHWRLLLRARAVENQVFVVGVNRVGRDGRGITYSGDSAVVDPWGKLLFEESHYRVVKTVTLSHKALWTIREKFPVWQDEDSLEEIWTMEQKGEW